MKKYLALAFLMNIVYVLHARAQSIVAGATVGQIGGEAPLPPPSILRTDTGLGWIDLMLKMFPYFWAVAGPIILGVIQTKGPQYIEKVPRALLPGIAAVWGSIGGLFAGLGSLGLDGGGVAIDTGMIQGGALGGTTQAVLQANAAKVVPVLTKEEQIARHQRMEA